MKRFTAGFTLVEIMIVIAIVALLASAAIPNILRGRTAANESAAIENLQTLQSALEMYRSVNNVYPATNTWMAEMYGANCAAGTAPDPDFGPPAFCVTMAASSVQQYDYTYAGAAAPAQTFTLLAVPETLGSSGSRSFYLDQTGLIRHCLGTGSVLQLSDESTTDQPPTACD